MRVREVERGMLRPSRGQNVLRCTVQTAPEVAEIGSLDFLQRAGRPERILQRVYTHHALCCELAMNASGRSSMATWHFKGLQD